MLLFHLRFKVSWDMLHFCRLVGYVFTRFINHGKPEGFFRYKNTKIILNCVFAIMRFFFSSCHLYFSLHGLDTFTPICVFHEMRFTKLKLWMGGIILGSYPSTWEWQNEGHPPDWNFSFPISNLYHGFWLLPAQCFIMYQSLTEPTTQQFILTQWCMILCINLVNVPWLK